MASARQDLSEGQPLGEDRLHEDFVARVVTPALLHAANDIAALPINGTGTHESIAQVHEKREGVEQHHQRQGIFQESFWYFMPQVMTGPRREASGLPTVAKSDYGNSKIMRFLSPYTGGDDNLIVEETPAADVHVDDGELGALLWFPGYITIVQFVFVFGGWNLVLGKK